MGQIDRILAKGRGLKIPPKVKKQPSFTHNLDPVKDNPVDKQNLERIANDPSRIDVTHQADPRNTVTRNSENDGINAATLSLVTELERKFELSFDNLAKLLGLSNGKVNIRFDGVDRKLFIDYMPNGIKADKVISDVDVNKADDKQTAV